MDREQPLGGSTPDVAVGSPSPTESLIEDGELFRAYFDAAPDAIVILDQDQGISRANTAAQALFGRSARQLIGQPLGALLRWDEADGRPGTPRTDIPLSGGWRTTTETGSPVTGRHENGQEFPLQVAVTTARLRERPCTIVTLRDLSDQAPSAAPVSSLNQDPLTGLPDTQVLTQYLELLTDVGTGPALIGLFVLDIEDVAAVQDSSGNAAGDDLLNALAVRLSGYTRPTDFLARLHGNRFALVTSLTGDREQAMAAEKQHLHALLARPFLAGTAQQRVTARIGAAVAPSQEADLVGGLLAQAESALENSGPAVPVRAGASLPVPAPTATEDAELADGLRTALADREFFLTFQPIVSLSQNRLRGFEALLRWNFQQRLIPPGQFIPVAERHGHIDAIGSWALDQACEQIAELSTVWGAPLQIAVNLSPHQLLQPQISDQISALLDRLELAPDQLTLEITEAALRDEDITEQTLRKLSSLGLHLALDDFGTGLFSLPQLHKFPLNLVKIDRFLITGIDDGPNPDREVVASMIALAHSLDLDVVAEGVETEQQAQVLRELGADEAQGYLFGRPMLPDQALEHCHDRYGTEPRHTDLGQIPRTTSV